MSGFELDADEQGRRKRKNGSCAMGGQPTPGGVTLEDAGKAWDRPNTKRGRRWEKLFSSYGTPFAS